MQPLPSVYGLFDYANSSIKCDFLDLYFSARCRFFLGNTSGAFFMAATLGVPVACANMAPLSMVFPYGYQDIGIPKLYQDSTSGRILNFKEVLSSSSANYRKSSFFREHGITLINSSPEDIRDLAVEQHLKVSGKFQVSRDDLTLQLQFKSLFSEVHYTYNSSSEIGTLFLRKHKHLL